MKCENLQEVRENIDRIDQEIVKLIAEREGFVRQAAKFKKNETAVAAPQRVEVVIGKVRGLAEEYGANCELVEKMYREMIAGFVSMEMEDFKGNLN